MSVTSVSFGGYDCVEDLKESTKRKNTFASRCISKWCMNRNLDLCHFLYKFTKGNYMLAFNSLTLEVYDKIKIFHTNNSVCDTLSPG